MMLADGIVDQTEMNFCTIMAEKLGFREDHRGRAHAQDFAGA
ncbi:MAG: hypothetical protein WKG07_42285 [Hymenobacter sp.]